MPALLIWGDTDAASPPRWGNAVHGFLPNSVHVVVRGGHVPATSCTDEVAGAMFRTGSSTGLDLAWMAKIRPVPFKLPGTSK